MATEADTPQPVPLTESVHLSAGEFNQLPEPTDYLLKSVHTQESSNFQNGDAHIDIEDDLGVSKGESFLESPLEAKVASEDKCRNQQPFEAVKMPHEAEKHLEENEKQIHIDEETISSEEKVLQQVEEMVNVNTRIEENTNDYEKEEEKTKIGGYPEAGTSKEVEKPEGSLDQHTLVSSLTPTDGGVQTTKEACLNNEIENSAVGTDATHIEGSVREQSSAGPEEKQPESCSSLLNEQGSETIKLIEKINTDKESRNDSAVGESLHTHNDQIEISESKETDQILCENEKTTGVACTSESQETIKLRENVKDASQVVAEVQKEKDAAVPVTGTDNTCLQKEDNSASEDTVKEILEEIGVSEVVEKPGETDRSEADKVKDEINSIQEVSDFFVKQEKVEKNIEVEVSSKEISGEEKNCGDNAAKESEINLCDSTTTTAATEEYKVEIKEHEIDLHGSSIQKDEPENEKTEKCVNVVTEGTDTICSGKNIVANTCTEEETLFERQEESSIEKHGKEKSTDIDVNDDDAISNKMDVPPTELHEKIESAVVEISNAADYEELEEVQELETGEKETNYYRTNMEEQVEKKKDACDVQMSKLETTEELDENGKYKTEEVISDEGNVTAFGEENIEQSSQPADSEKKTTALGHEVKENENNDNAENEEVEDGPKISGIGEVTTEQSIEGDGTQILAEPYEDTVKIAQDTVEVAEVSGKEDIDKQITEENVKGLSQESVQECTDENLQNEQKSNDISSGEVHEEAETAKAVDDISTDLKKNDEMSASTLQTSLQEEEGSLQIKEVTPSGPSISEAKGKDEESTMKDREPENSEVLEEVKENKETESSKHEELEKILQNNISVENLEESTGVVSTETEKDDSSKTADTGRHQTVENAQDNVNEKETQNDEKNSEMSKIEVPKTSENDENSNSTLETCLIKEKEIMKDDNLTPTEASVTAELYEDGYSKIKDEQLENNEVQTKVNDKIEVSREHEENLEQPEKNKPVENVGEPKIVEYSEIKNHVYNEIIKNLEVETVEKDGSDIKDDYTVFEAVDEDKPDKKADTVEAAAVNKDENDLRNYKAESETVEKDNFDEHADNAEVKTIEEDNVDKKEEIAAVETVKENNFHIVADDAEVEKTENDAAEDETVGEHGLDKNADVEIVEKDVFGKKNDESKVEQVEEGGVIKSPDNAEVESIKEDGVDKKTDDAEIDTADSNGNEPKAAIGKQDDPKEHIIYDQTDAKNAEDSNDKVVEPTKSAEKDENIADDANQSDEIPSTCISTSSIKETERSHEEYQNVPPLEFSPDEKKEDLSWIKTDKGNENTAAFEEKIPSVDEEPSKEVDESTNDKNQNDESTNTILQNTTEEEQEILERDNQAEAEASPAELKDEDLSYIKTDEDNDNNDVVLEVKDDKQEEELKDEESISIISGETMADASSKITGGMENAETPDDIGKHSEVANEENTVPEASHHHDPVKSQNDEEYDENSSREILGEFETARTGENIAQEKDQKDESPSTKLPSSSVEKEKSPRHEDADTTLAEASIDESREKDDAPIKSGENNDCNAEKIEIEEETPKSEEISEQATEKRQMEGGEEASKNEEKLEEEVQKNEPEEFLEQSSNFVAVETDAGTLSERAIDTSLGEVGTIQKFEGKTEKGREGAEENMNEGQAEKTVMEKVSAEANISGTSEGTEKIIAMNEEETETDILSLPTEKEISATEAQVEEEAKEQDAVDTVDQAPEEENIVTDKSNVVAGEKISETEMTVSVSKQEVNEIIQTAERDYSSEKQMTEEGNAIEDKAEEPKRERDKEDSEEKENEKECNETEPKEEVEGPKSEAIGTIEAISSEEENQNEGNVTELKEEVEEPKSDSTGTIEASSSEEAKGSETSTKEGSEPLPTACTDSLPEISSSKDKIIEKEKLNPKDDKVTEGTKEISQSKPEIDDKVQTESSIPTSEESGLKLNPEETTLDYVSTEPMNGGENKDQESLEVVDKVKEDTDELEKETNSEGGGLTTKSEVSSKEAVEMEKSEIELKEGDIATKAEVDISNETVQMEEREIAFGEAISEERDSATKAEVSSKEDAEMNSETIEPEVPISGEENSVKEVEEASSEEAIEVDKVTTESGTPILEGALTTKPEASSKETIKVDTKEIKTEEAIYKDENSAKKHDLSLNEVEGEKFSVEPEIPTSEAENPVAMVEVSSKTATEVEKAESDPEAAVFKEGNLATKTEVALNKDIEAEKEATQPEVVISQEVDPKTEVEESSDAAISKEEDSAKNIELSLKKVEAEIFAVEPEIATSEGENPIAIVTVNSETATEVEKVESEPEAAALKQGDSAKATQHEVVVSQEVDPVTKVEESSEVAISEGGDLATKVKASTEAPIQPEVFVSQEVDATTKIEASSKADTSEEGDSARKVEAIPEAVTKEEKVENVPEVAVSEGGDLATKSKASSDADIEMEKADIEPEAAIPKEKDSAAEFGAAFEEDVAVQKSTTEMAILEEVNLVTKLEKANIEPEGATSEERDSTTKFKVVAVAEDDVAADKSTTEPELEISEESTKEAELDKVAIFKERDSATEFKVASEDVKTQKSATEPEVGISEEVTSATTVGGSTKEADDMEKQDTEPETDILKEKDSAAEAASKEDIEAHKSTTETELTISEEVDSVKKIGGSTKEADVVEIQDTKPEAANWEKKDSATEFEAASQENFEVKKSTTEPDVAFSEKVDSVTTIEGSKKEADEMEKQDIKPEAAISKKTNSATVFEAASEEDVEAQKSISEPGVAVSEEVDSATEFKATSAEDVEAQKSTTEPEVAISEEAANSEEKNSTAEFEMAKEEDTEVQKSKAECEVAISEEAYSVTNIEERTKEADKLEEQDIKPEAAISIQKDSVTEFEADSEEDAEVPTTISKMAISEELDSDTKFGGSTKEVDEAQNQDIEPEAAISKEKDSAIEFEAASEVDAEVQKLTTKTEVAICEEVDSVTKVERSVNEADSVEKSDTCGERDSEVEASQREATKVEKADIFAEVVSDTKVEASVNEEVEIEKAAVEPEVAIHEAEDSEAKVQITYEYAEVEKEATEPPAAISTQRDVVTEAELSIEAVEVEKKATKAEEAISEAVVSDRNLEDRSVEAVEVEKALTELEGRVPEVESRAPKIHETPMDSNAESTEPGNKAACSSEIETKGQGNETVSGTSKREIEENRNDPLDHSCQSSEKKSLHESQEIQQDVQQEKIEATVEVEEYIKKPPKTDDTIEVATLTTEVHGDLKKTNVNIEKPDAKELYNVSVQEEKINEVKESSAEGIESLNAIESNENEVQKITETSLEKAQENDKQVQVPDVPSDSSSNGTENEGSQSNNAVETQDENADITEETKKDSETVVKSKDHEFYTAETEAEIEATVEEMTEKQHGTPENTEVDETRESKAETGEIGEKTKELSQETLIFQDDKTVIENDIPIVKTIPEEVEKKQCETQEKAKVAGKETPQNLEIAESKMDSDIVKESSKHELCSDETGEDDEVTKSISKNQDEEAVIEKEIIVLQAHSETKEQLETASPVMPPREEACETKAATKEIQQQKREIFSEADENPETSEQNATEEMSLQQEEPKVQEHSKLEPELKGGEVYTNYEECEKKEQSLGEAKDQIKQSFEGVEPTTVEEVSRGQTLTEKASEVQNRPSPDELVLEKQEHRNWTVIEKTAQNVDETEVLKHKEKETEQRIFDKEESKKPEVCTKEAIDTQEGAVQIVNEEDYESISKHDSDSRNSGETKEYQSSSVLTEETKEQVEMTDISEKIQMDSSIENVKEKIEEVGLAVDENLREKIAVSDKILDCGTETREDAETLASEFRSHEGLVESLAETEKKFPEAAVTQSTTEENLSKKPIGETESIPYEVKEQQIELEKERDKDYLSISHREGTAEDKHVEFELKAEDSNVNDSIVIEKEKNIEEVHKETDETLAANTMVDQINTEKRTVELCQAVTAEGTEEIIEKEKREVKTSTEEDLSKEVSTGITEEKGTTGGTSLGENLNATPEKLIMNEAEPKKTTEVTTITDRSIETTEAIDESTESAKISLFDMMQRSAREKQAIIQENEPKYEVKAETAEKIKLDEEREEDEDDEEHKKNDSGSDAPVMVEASKDIDVKVIHKKSHNILSGVGSKVKHSISKVKKAITGKSSHSKQHSPKSGAKEQLNY